MLDKILALSQFESNPVEMKISKVYALPSELASPALLHIYYILFLSQCIIFSSNYCFSNLHLPFLIANAYWWRIHNKPPWNLIGFLFIAVSKPLNRLYHPHTHPSIHPAIPHPGPYFFAQKLLCMYLNQRTHDFAYSWMICWLKYTIKMKKNSY